MKGNKLLTLVAFCFGLLIVRLFLTEKASFFFLLWNLFLAWLPLFFVKLFHQTDVTWKKISTVLLCILFLPNAPYIITDLFHLKKELVAPLWLDTILILSFALTGLCFFLLTIQELLSLVKRFRNTQRIHLLSKCMLMVLSAYGVYLGRYLRFNSWDIISDPCHLAKGMARSIFHHDHFKETFGMTITFAAFLFLIYELYEILITSKQNTNEIHDPTNKGI
jgi:uncharacterized membrane protein